MSNPEWLKESLNTIGGLARASDLVPDLVVPDAPKLVKEDVLPVASFEELERPSPKPFKGRPDPDYPELDSLDNLYAARFLIRKWGREKWGRSAFLALWKSEATRPQRLGWDPKPSEKKKP